MAEKRNWIRYTVILLLLILPIMEIYLQLRENGLPKYKPFVPDLGWQNIPGTICSDEDIGILEMTWENRQRASRFPQNKKSPMRVACIGCSYTKGRGVRDEETFVWKLNQRFPQATFDNLGVTGYGPYQCMMLLEDILKKQKYDLVLYFSIDDHINRFVRPEPIWITEFSCDCLSIMPWVELGPDGSNIYHPATSWAWPGSRTWLSINFLNRIAVYLNKLLHQAPPPRGIVRINIYYNILLRMQQICQQHHTDFKVIALENNYSILPPFPSEINNFSVIYPLSPIHLGPEYRVNNKPENHPNRIIHNYWASAIAKELAKTPQFAKYEANCQRTP
ncbi:hypothetical protein IJT17_09740 [bacterium]|nr:hypothetical protein [bacterium]